MIDRIDSGDLMSQATVWNGMACLSGQVALDSRGADLRTQALEIFARIDTILGKIGTDRSRLLTATIWLSEIEDFQAFNTLWSEWLGPAPRPARATVRADLVLPGLRLEVQVTAAAG